MKPGFIYIMTNKNHTTLYTGVTSDIVQRVEQHRTHFFEKSFTSKYNLTKLVHYEVFQQIGDAIGREKQIKAGSRQKKIDLINSLNPNWNDLYHDVLEKFSNIKLPL